MNSIRWVNQYDLFVGNDKHFKVFVSEDHSGQFHAGCLWYEFKNESLLEAVDFKLETRVDTNAEAALQHILQWITERFESAYRLTPQK